MRNKVNNLKKFAKSHFFLLSKIKLKIIAPTVPKNYWKAIKKNYKYAESLPVLKKVSNTGLEEFCFTDQDKANCLNDYFVSISNLDDSHTVVPHFDLKSDSSLAYIVITKADVEDIKENLDVNKSVGHDHISHKVLKNVRFTISIPLCMLFNKSLNDGKFPWKLANVLPLFEKRDKDTPGKYRPISLLSCIGKLMERCVYKYRFIIFIFVSSMYNNKTTIIKAY